MRNFLVTEMIERVDFVVLYDVGGSREEWKEWGGVSFLFLL